MQNMGTADTQPNSLIASLLQILIISRDLSQGTGGNFSILTFMILAEPKRRELQLME